MTDDRHPNGAGDHRGGPAPDPVERVAEEVWVRRVPRYPEPTVAAVMAYQKREGKYL